MFDISAISSTVFRVLAGRGDVIIYAMTSARKEKKPVAPPFDTGTAGYSSFEGSHLPRQDTSNIVNNVFMALTARVTVDYFSHRNSREASEYNLELASAENSKIDVDNSLYFVGKLFSEFKKTNYTK